MNLPVMLAGYTGSWRFRSSGALDAWLHSRPWTSQGGVHVLRLGSSRQGPEMARAIRRAVRGHDDGDHDVQVHIVDPPPAGAGLRPLLEDKLQIPGGLDRRAFLEQAAKAFSCWPTVMVVHPSEQPDPRWLGEAQELVDRTAKIQATAQATLIFLDTHVAQLPAEAFDFTVGGPSDPVLGDVERRDATFWRAYVHARLAWEVAGDLPRALLWDERGFYGLPYSADGLLENLLNQGAESAGQELDPDVLQELLNYLRHIVVPRASGLRSLGAVPPSLLQTGMFWRPPGEADARPAPWLARALLRADMCPEAGFYLRGSLVCAPLSREVLSRCFDLEARQRAIGWAARGTARPPIEAEERFHRFLERWPGSGADYYPNDCPAAPTDAWAFTMFGEFLAAVPLERGQLQPHHDLRNLRNAVAHGHYISWATLMDLRRIEKQLGC